MKNFKYKEPTEVETATQVLKVKDYMTSELITFEPDTPVLTVAQTLLKHKITGAPVLDSEGNVVGLIDDKDCLRVVFETLYHNHPVIDKTAKHYMSNVMKTIHLETDILEAANIFLTTPYKRLLVTNSEGKLSGQISRRDILKALFSQ